MPCCLNASSSSLASMSCESTAVSRGKFDVRVDHRLERASEKQARIRNRLGRIARRGAGEVPLLGIKLCADDGPPLLARADRLDYCIAYPTAARIRKRCVARAGRDDARGAEGAGGHHFKALE